MNCTPMKDHLLYYACAVVLSGVLSPIFLVRVVESATEQQAAGKASPPTGSRNKLKVRRKKNLRSSRANSFPKDQAKSLLAKAQANGVVHLLVGLRVPFEPEGNLSPQAVAGQRRAIAEAQDALLKRLTRCNSKIESVKRFEFTPYLAMAIDVVGLKCLLDAPEVKTIVEDALASPTG